MKVLITNNNPWGTGSFTAADAILYELKAAGHIPLLFFPDTGIASEEKSHFYSHPEIYEIWKFPIKDGKFTFPSFPLIIPDFHPRSLNSKTYFQLTDEEFSCFLKILEKKIAQVIKNFKPDIVECHHIWSMGYICSKLGIPYINTAHSSDQMGFKYDTRMQPFNLTAAKKALFNFAVSDHVREEVIKLYGLNKEQVITIENGFHETIFYPQELNRKNFLKQFHLQIPEDAILFSFAGRISKIKGIDILIKALSLIENPKLHFLLFGTGLPSDFIEDKELDDPCLNQMHFLGQKPLKTIAEAHNICDFSVVSSRSEGFCISALEAMACGLPVIATTVGGVKDFAVGTLVEPENPQQLAHAIKSMANLSTQEYAKLSKLAREKALEFSWRKSTQTRIKYYKKALQKPPG